MCALLPAHAFIGAQSLLGPQNTHAPTRIHTSQSTPARYKHTHTQVHMCAYTHPHMQERRAQLAQEAAEQERAQSARRHKPKYSFYGAEAAQGPTKPEVGQLPSQLLVCALTAHASHTAQLQSARKMDGWRELLSVVWLKHSLPELQADVVDGRMHACRCTCGSRCACAPEHFLSKRGGACAICFLMCGYACVCALPCIRGCDGLCAWQGPDSKRQQEGPQDQL